MPGRAWGAANRFQSVHCERPLSTFPPRGEDELPGAARRVAVCPQVECSDKDLHSGVYGGSVHEAMTDLIMLMGERGWAPAAIRGSSLPPSLSGCSL